MASESSIYKQFKILVRDAKEKRSLNELSNFVKGLSIEQKKRYADALMNLDDDLSIYLLGSGDVRAINPYIVELITFLIEMGGNPDRRFIRELMDKKKHILEWFSKIWNPKNPKKRDDPVLKYLKEKNHKLPDEVMKIIQEKEKIYRKGYANSGVFDMVNFGGANENIMSYLYEPETLEKRRQMMRAAENRFTEQSGSMNQIDPTLFSFKKGKKSKKKSVRKSKKKSVRKIRKSKK